MNLYSILELESNASHDDIRKAYKKLALRYHPDKNLLDTQAGEKFHSIQMAYEILGDPVQRAKYDTMNPKKKQTIFDMIGQMYQKFKGSEEFKEYIKKNIFENDEAKTVLLSGDKEVIREYVYNKANGYIMGLLTQSVPSSNPNGGLQDDDLLSIFIPENPDKKTYDIMQKDKVLSLETSIQTQTQRNEHLLELNIITDLDEIYMDKVKEIIVQRQRFKDKQIIMDEKKFYIPLGDDRIILEKEGDDYIDSNGYLQRGDVLVKIKSRKHKMLKRVNDYDLLLVLPITLYELYKGFDKRFEYLGGQEIKIKSSCPLVEYKFDSEKIVLTIENKGIPYLDPNTGLKQRGSLIIFLVLTKDELFYKKLKKYFS
jgi:DnaJ-class molecular chaperone